MGKRREEEEDGDLLSFPLKDEIKSPPTFSPPPGETLFCIYENATVLLFFSRTQFPGRKEKKRDAQKVFFPFSFSSPPPLFGGRVSQALLIPPKEKREAEFDLQ